MIARCLQITSCASNIRSIEIWWEFKQLYTPFLDGICALFELITFNWCRKPTYTYTIHLSGKCWMTITQNERSCLLTSSPAPSAASCPPVAATAAASGALILDRLWISCKQRGGGVHTHRRSTKKQYKRWSLRPSRPDGLDGSCARRRQRQKICCSGI